MGEADSLQERLAGIIPGARLDSTPLPDCPDITLCLLSADYPRGALDGEALKRVMDNPLYWVFCWASGQVLAQVLLREPGRVRGKRVVDFGCGSGVVAIAAALAGAAEVIACDSDALALDATARNARLNGVDVLLSPDFDAIEGPVDLLVAADVLYDRENLPWLKRFVERAPQVLVADSRLKDFDFPPYHEIARHESCTFPDLDESRAFREVRLYQAG